MAAESGADAPIATATPWWRLAWYPVAIPLALVIKFWASSAIHPIWLVRPAIVVVVVVLLIHLAIAAVLRDRNRSALATFFIALGLILDNTTVTLGLFVAAAAAIAEGLLRRGHPWRLGEFATRAFSTICAVLLIVTVATGLQGDGLAGHAADDVQHSLDGPHRADAFNQADPDIYVVLLDGYPGDSAAALDPAFDADRFPDALAGRGFDVERNSRSNYLLTRLTVATMLAGEHVADAPELDPQNVSLSVDARRLRAFGDDGVVLTTLRDRGYETVTVSSPTVHLGLRFVDRVIDPPGVTELEAIMLKTMAAGRLLDATLPDLFAALGRNQLLATYAAAEEIAAEPHDRPRFIWTHIMGPHPPYLFHADGSPIMNAPVLRESFADPDAGALGQENLAQAFGYAAFVGDRTVKLVDRIIAADPEAVIVVFSDHGTETEFNAGDPLGTNFDERSSNFLAVRTPGHPELLPPGTTPINVLTGVLNGYFGTDFARQPDTVWAWGAGGSVLNVVEVTGRLADRP